MEFSRQRAKTACDSIKMLSQGFFIAETFIGHCKEYNLYKKFMEAKE